MGRCGCTSNQFTLSYRPLSVRRIPLLFSPSSLPPDGIRQTRLLLIAGHHLYFTIEVSTGKHIPKLLSRSVLSRG